MDMARNPRLPPYVYRETTRHGRAVYYFRRGKGERIRLPDFGAPSFEDAYFAAMQSGPAPAARVQEIQGSLAWLIERYRESSTYLGLSRATRRQRDAIFIRVKARAGGESYRKFTREHIIKAREKHMATPNQARHIVDALRGLFRWAVDVQHVAIDPTEGVKAPRQRAGAGFAAWDEDDVTAYEARWPEGTRERVWLHVLLFTGLRRGDAVRLGRQHIRDGVATIRTEKTGTEVAIPLHSRLKATLQQGPVGDLHFITGAGGGALAKESFGNLFRAACTAAAIRKSAHGLRKLAATRLAEAGATVAEIESVFGWSGGRMASHYTRTANRRKLSEQAMARIDKPAAEGETANEFSPHLLGRRPAP